MPIARPGVKFFTPDTQLSRLDRCSLPHTRWWSSPSWWPHRRMPGCFAKVLRWVPCKRHWRQNSAFSFATICLGLRVKRGPVCEGGAGVADWGPALIFSGISLFLVGGIWSRFAPWRVCEFSAHISPPLALMVFQGAGGRWVSEAAEQPRCFFFSFFFPHLSKRPTVRRRVREKVSENKAIKNDESSRRNESAGTGAPPT